MRQACDWRHLVVVRHERRARLVDVQGVKTEICEFPEGDGFWIPGGANWYAKVSPTTVSPSSRGRTPTGTPILA